MTDGEHYSRVTWFAEQAIDRGYILLGLGGDHSVTRFFLRPFIRAGSPPFGLIHFDAHTDLYQLDSAVFSHGNPFDEVLRSQSMKVLYQIGQRQLRTDRGAPVPEPRLHAVSARDVWRQAPEALFADLPRDLPYYVTFDVDCMSAVECPETGTPVPGGLTYYQVLELFDWLVRNVDLLGADFVEVAGPVGPRNQAALICANLAARVVLGRGAASELKSQLFRAEKRDPLDVSANERRRAH